jgi:hypothetical protein
MRDRSPQVNASGLIDSRQRPVPVRAGPTMTAVDASEESSRSSNGTSRTPRRHAGSSRPARSSAR